MNNSTDKEIAEESECDGEVKPIDQRINEARSRAEVILSNQSWVQLLSLGSFMRAMPVASQPTNTSLTSARTSPTQPMNRQVPTDITGTIESDSVVEAKPLPIQSTLTTSNSISVDSRPMENLAITQTQTLTPASNSSPVLPPSSVLQVDDLDRMESEFLTFLDYDLAARSQDLDTCWGLLVGNKSY
ncbi:hypothetical protein FBU30_003751 [Linnemannia zychae]|nr:hypothetical protein FBU30_003751 [Linnemannia zychae]